MRQYPRFPRHGCTSEMEKQLVSSSLPLEFEAAKILVSKGFSTSADFAYARSDSGFIKDFSVDLHATGYIPFSNPNEVVATLQLLVECKQRHPNISWLFCKPGLQQHLHLAPSCFFPPPVRSCLAFLFELRLGGAAHRAYPGIGQILESRARRYSRCRIAFRRIINIAAYDASITSHRVDLLVRGRGSIGPRRLMLPRPLQFIIGKWAGKSKPHRT